MRGLDRRLRLAKAARIADALERGDLLVNTDDRAFVIGILRENRDKRAAPTWDVYDAARKVVLRMREGTSETVAIDEVSDEIGVSRQAMKKQKDFGIALLVARLFLTIAPK